MRSPALQRTVIRARLRMPVREVAEHAAVSAAASAREHLGPVVLASVSRDLAGDRSEALVRGVSRRAASRLLPGRGRGMPTEGCLPAFLPVLMLSCLPRSPGSGVPLSLRARANRRMSSSITLGPSAVVALGRGGLLAFEGFLPGCTRGRVARRRPGQRTASRPCRWADRPGVGKTTVTPTQLPGAASYGARQVTVSVTFGGKWQGIFGAIWPGPARAVITDRYL